MFRPAPVTAQAYVPPSRETLQLVRKFRWLTSPESGLSSRGARLCLHFLIAPMTQLAFFNFDLQAFLFLVFHRSPLAIVGHAWATGNPALDFVGTGGGTFLAPRDGVGEDAARV